MAMTDREKQGLNRFLTSTQLGGAIATIVDSGSASALVANAEYICRQAFANTASATSFIAAIEGGTALSEGCKRDLRRGMGKRDADTLITQIDALT